jgi:hypothetical protein
VTLDHVGPEFSDGDIQIPGQSLPNLGIAARITDIQASERDIPAPSVKPDMDLPFVIRNSLSCHLFPPFPGNRK